MRLVTCGVLVALTLVILCNCQWRALAGDKENPVITFAKEHVKDPAKPFTLIVIVKAKEGSAERFENVFARARVATRKEKGCIAYDLNRDTKDAHRYVVYERWKSLADLDSHLKTEHIRTLLKALPELTVGMPELRILIPAAE